MNLAKWSLLVMVTIILSAPLPALASDSNDSDSILDNYEFEVDFVNGYFSGGPIAHLKNPIGKLKFNTKKSWLTGFRFDADKEYHGFELSLLGTFQNVKSFHLDGYTRDLATSTWLMTSINALLYPTGNKILDGRIKPYITLGPGFTYLHRYSEKFYDANAGIGVKIKLGEKKNFVIRIDYRWHLLMGSDNRYLMTTEDHKVAKLDTEFARDEFTIGLGIIF